MSISEDQAVIVNYFIDTSGDHADNAKNDTNISIKGSDKKKKQKNNVSLVNIEEDKPGK